MAGCTLAEVTSCRGSRANSFRVVASVNRVSETLGLTWIDADPLLVAIDFSLLDLIPDNGDPSWVNMIQGSVDRISLDQVSGQVVLEGRDHAARLIDTTVEDGFLNKTSAEVAQVLASRCGLSSNIDSTAGLIGQYYQIQHTKSAFAAFSRHANAWDLLAELAELEQFELWVEGNTLYFKRPDFSSSNTYDLTYQAPDASNASSSLTISNLSMERAGGLSGAMRVRVVSWNSRQKCQIESIYPLDAGEGSPEFLIVRPNLLPDEAERLSRSSYTTLRCHQRVLSGTMAGELELTPRHRIRLCGTGTSWDGAYTLDSIEREISVHGGFSQHITARIDPTDGDSSG